MSINKKQKKQIDVAHKKMAQLRLQLSGAKKQQDEPDEIIRLEREIATLTTQLEKLQEGEG